MTEVVRYVVGLQRPAYALAQMPDHADVKIKLSEGEYRDYREMMDAYVRWQNKLADLYGT
jgi:hypothetical protein